MPKPARALNIKAPSTARTAPAKPQVTAAQPPKGLSLTARLAVKNPQAPRPVLRQAVVSAVKTLGATASLSSLLDHAHNWIKKNHPKFHAGATNAIKHVNNIIHNTPLKEVNIIKKMAPALLEAEQRLLGPAAKIGDAYGKALMCPFSCPPCVVPDLKLYRTGTFKYPTKVTMNTVASTGTDTSHFVRIAAYPFPTTVANYSTTYVNGVETASTSKNDENLAFFTATAISQRVVHMGIRLRNITSAQTRTGRWAAIRVPQGTVASLTPLTFAQLESYPGCLVGDFAERESMVLKWLPAGTSDLAFVSPSASPASDNTVLYIMVNASTAQLIEADVIPCYEYRAIVALEAGLPVSISIGDEAAAAAALNEAMMTGKMDDTRDPMPGEAIPGWPGGSGWAETGGSASIPVRGSAGMRAAIRAGATPTPTHSGPDAVPIPEIAKLTPEEVIRRTYNVNPNARNDDGWFLGKALPWLGEHAISLLGSLLFARDADRALSMATMVDCNMLASLEDCIAQNKLPSSFIVPFRMLYAMQLDWSPLPGKAGYSMLTPDGWCYYGAYTSPKDPPPPPTFHIASTTSHHCPVCPPEFDCECQDPPVEVKSDPSNLAAAPPKAVGGTGMRRR